MTRKAEILIGKYFGKLEVLSLDHREQKGLYWLCQCECGNKTIVRSNYLLSGHSKSCGCLGESLIATELKEKLSKKYNAIPEYRILKNPDSGYWLRCDIYIGKPDTINGIWIEIHGWHHYTFSLRYHITKEYFKYRQKIDKLKKNFAKKHGTYIEVDLRKIKTIEQAMIYVENLL